MSESTEHESLLLHLRYIREAVDGTNLRLDALNGRTRENEQAIAVLRDRSSEARNAAVKWGAGISAVVTGVVTALYHLFGGK